MLPITARYTISTQHLNSQHLPNISTCESSWYFLMLCVSIDKWPAAFLPHWHNFGQLPFHDGTNDWHKISLIHRLKELLLLTTGPIQHKRICTDSINHSLTALSRWSLVTIHYERSPHTALSSLICRLLKSLPTASLMVISDMCLALTAFLLLLLNISVALLSRQSLNPIIPRLHSYCLSLLLCLEWYNGSITPWMHSGVTKPAQCRLHYGRPRPCNKCVKPLSGVW